MVDDAHKWRVFMTECEDLALELGESLPTSVYRFAPFMCWECKSTMLVYAWPGGDDYSTDMPPVGKPSTVLLTYSSSVEQDYWANVCPYCNALQGSFYVFMEPDSALFGLGRPLGDTEFGDDMLRIARYWHDEIGPCCECRPDWCSDWGL